MASLEQRSGRFRVVFRFAGRKFNRSLKTANRMEAASSLARLEDNLRRLELGTLVLPDHSDVASFLFRTEDETASRALRKSTVWGNCWSGIWQVCLLAALKIPRGKFFKFINVI